MKLFTCARVSALASRASTFLPGAWFLVLMWFLTPLTAHAEIQEPDNVIYGTITLSNVAVTAARTDVVIEALRTTNGPVVASYRMGSNPRLGNFYALAVPVESVAPVTNEFVTQFGDALILVVSDATGFRGQAGYTVGDRGQVQRVDIGTSMPDIDSDGLPDAWELFYFGALHRNADFMAANGLTALQNYISGSDPSSTNGLFELSIVRSNNQHVVSFLGRRAEGPGYEGRSRFYAVETTPGLAVPAWSGVPGFTNLAGNNQLLILQTMSTNVGTMYRGRVWLQGP